MGKIRRLGTFLFILLIALIVGLQTYNYRSNFLTPYDYSYNKDLYDYSQWQLAVSKRSIGDETLYQVAGYELIKTKQNFMIAPEVPPFGEYLYGYSILLFNNPYWASLALYLTSIISFYTLAKLVFKKTAPAQLSLLLFILQPLLFYQQAVTMLDLPQLIALLIHTIALFKIIKHKQTNIGWSILAGVSLGLFVVTKIGFLIGIVLIADLYLLFKNKKLISSWPIPFFAGATYLLIYYQYFLQGHSIIEFLKAQKWMLTFHLSSKIKPIWGMVLISLFSGLYKGWSDNASWTLDNKWSILWPLLLFCLVSYLFRFFREKKLGTAVEYLVFLSSLFLFFYLFIPFWVRYLILVIPFLILLFVNFLPKKITIPYYLVLTIIIFQAIFFCLPNPQKITNHLEKLWQAGLYQDLYSFVDAKTKHKFTRQQFWRQWQKLEKELDIIDRSVEITNVKAWPWQNTVDLSTKVTYHTKLGPIINQGKTQLIKKHNTWYLVWKTNLALKDYQKKSKIITTYIEPKGGTFTTADNTILSYYDYWPFFQVQKNQIVDEVAMQKQLFMLTGIKNYYQENKYKANNQMDWPADIGFLLPQRDKEILKRIKLQPGILVSERKTRIYNILEFSQKIEFIKKLEGQYASQLNPQLGGKIVLINQNKKKNLIERETKEGQDVKLDSGYNEQLGL